MFVESGNQNTSLLLCQLIVSIIYWLEGAVRIVENKYLRRDPQDEGPSITNRLRGGQATRIYTPRRGATHRGGW